MTVAVVSRIIAIIKVKTVARADEIALVVFVVYCVAVVIIIITSVIRNRTPALQVENQLSTASWCPSVSQGCFQSFISWYRQKGRVCRGLCLAISFGSHLDRLLDHGRHLDNQ